MTIIYSNIYLYKLLNVNIVQATMSNGWACLSLEERRLAECEFQWKEVTDTLDKLDWKGLTPDGQWAAIMVHHPARHRAKHRGHIHYPLTVPKFMEMATWFYAMNNDRHPPTHTANHPYL